MQTGRSAYSVFAAWIGRLLPPRDPLAFVVLAGISSQAVNQPPSGLVVRRHIPDVRSNVLERLPESIENRLHADGGEDRRPEAVPPPHMRREQPPEAEEI